MNRSPSDGQIRTRRDGPLFLIEIDRPAKLNGFTPQMLRDLAYALTAFEQDPDARCAVLSAAGLHFTAGLDLPQVSAAWARGETVYPDNALDMFNLRQPFRTKPLVVAVQGIASRSASS